MTDWRANQSISRQTERLHRADARDERETERHSAAYARECQGYMDAAGRLDEVALRHLVNRGYRLSDIAIATGRSVEEMRAATAPPFGGI